MRFIAHLQVSYATAENVLMQIETQHRNGKYVTTIRLFLNPLDLQTCEKLHAVTDTPAHWTILRHIEIAVMREYHARGLDSVSL